jgi:hypothetical protein
LHAAARLILRTWEDFMAGVHPGAKLARTRWRPPSKRCDRIPAGGSERVGIPRLRFAPPRPAIGDRGARGIPGRTGQSERAFGPESSLERPQKV